MKYDIINERIKNLTEENRQLLEKFIRHLGDVSQETVNLYSRVIVGIMCFAEKENMNIERFKPYDIEDFLDTFLDIKKSSEATYLAIISSFFNFLILREIVATNPAIMLRKSNRRRWRKNHDIGDIITINQFKHLLKVASFPGIRRRDEKIIGRNVAAISLLGGSGIRSIELIRTDIDDFDLNQGILKVLGKGDKKRTVALSPDAVISIEYYLKFVRPLFSPSDSERALFIGYPQNAGLSRINGTQISSLVRGAFKKSDIRIKNIGPHTLRRSHATWILQKTGNLKLVQDQLGHSDLSTTQRYVKMADMDRLRAVREAFGPFSKDLDS